MTTFILIVLLSSEGVGVINAGEFDSMGECTQAGNALVMETRVKTYTCFPSDNGSI